MNSRNNFLIILFLSILVTLTACSTPPQPIDPNDGSQENADDISSQNTELEIKGSDTLLQLVSNLAESFTENNPQARISVTGGGSGTGIAALLNGEIDVADASRQIKDEERELAEEIGVGAYEVIIARDALSVIVHEENSVDKLTMDQLSSIFKGETTNWKDVGGADKDITLYGRQSTSGTYAFFMEHVVQADYSANMRNMEGNQAILEAIQLDKSGIGYVGLGYIVDSEGNQIEGINVVSVAESESSDYISPLAEGEPYPISRPLYQYLAKLPEENSMTLKFIKFETGPQGQEIVKDTGFLPYTEADAQVNKDTLGMLI